MPQRADGFGLEPVPPPNSGNIELVPHHKHKFQVVEIEEVEQVNEVGPVKTKTTSRTLVMICGCGQVRELDRGSYRLRKFEEE